MAAVNVVGLPRFERTMSKASRDLGDLDRAVTVTTQVVMAAARRRAPRRSGRLAGSLETGAEKNLAMIGSSVVYAGPVHWGWRTRGIDPNRFVLDAAEETRPVWTRAFEKDMATAVDGVKGA